MSLESHTADTETMFENSAGVWRTWRLEFCEHEMKHTSKRFFLQGLVKHRKNDENALSLQGVGYLYR